MSWLNGLIVKLVHGLIEKLAKFLWRAFLLDKEIKEKREAIQKESDAVNQAVEEAKKDGEISKEEENKIREKTRNLIHGTFDK